MLRAGQRLDTMDERLVEMEQHLASIDKRLESMDQRIGLISAGVQEYKSMADRIAKVEKVLTVVDSKF